MSDRSGCRFRVTAVALVSAGLCVFASSAWPQVNEYAGESIALALEAQEYALGITSAASSDSNPGTAVENAQRAIGTARRAIQLDNSIALAYSVIGLANRQIWRWSDAQDAFEYAYELDPNDPGIAFNFGWFNSFAGEHARAIAVAQRAIGLNSNSANVHRDLGIAFAYAGNETGASAALRQCIALDSSIGVCHIYLGFMQMRLGNLGVAEAELREAERLFGDAMSPAAASSLAHAYFRTELRSDAERLFERLVRMSETRVVGVGSWPLAYLAIGDEASAYEWLVRSVDKSERFEPDEGFFNLMLIKHNVQSNPVLEEPRFFDLRVRLGAIQDSGEIDE